MKTSIHFRRINNLIVTVLAFLICSLSFAQAQQFMTEAIPGEIIKNQELEKFEAKIRGIKTIARFNYIKLGSLAKSQKDGLLALKLPGLAKPVLAKAKRVKYESDQDYEWIGTTDDGRGSVIILCNKGMVTAHISSSEGVYEISPGPNKLYCFQEIDHGTANDVGCLPTSRSVAGDDQVEPEKPNSSGSDANARMEACNPVTSPRVLVLYTAEALSFAGSVLAIQLTANLSISQFNESTNRSDITGLANLSLAGVAPLNFTQTPSNPEGDVNNLIANATAQNLRSQYKADLVVLYTHAYYNGGGARGVSGTKTLENNKAYAIVEYYASTGTKTFAHEVGHLYGCRHNGDDTVAPSYAQGHDMKNFLGSVVDQTMMSTSENGTKRVLNFSNPNINVNGRATGTNDHNNARRISESWGTVGNFQPNPSGLFGAYIEGPTLVSTAGSRNFELVYSCGTAPYSFSWQYSYDGVNYYNANLNSDTYSVYFYETQQLFLKGTVTGNGQSYTAYTSVYAQIPGQGLRVGADETANKDVDAVETYPNPADDVVKIKYILKSAQKVKIDMMDQSGRVVSVLESGNKELAPGMHQHEWKAKNATSGRYFLRVQRDGKTEIKRILVIR